MHLSFPFFLLLLFLSVSGRAEPVQGKPVLRAMSFSDGAHADRVDINRADADELCDRLKGVGQKKAQAIVDYRNEHGAFRSLRDLEKVKGIGPALVKKNRHLLVLSEK